MKEDRVVAARGQADRVDVLDPVGEAPGEARLLGGPLGLGDGFGGEVDALDPGAEALGQDVPLEQARPAADRQPERQGRRGVLRGEPLHRPAIGVARDPAVDGPPDQRLGAPVAVLGLARGAGVPELPGGGRFGARGPHRAPSPCEGGERIADGRRHYWETRSSVAGHGAFWRNP